MEELLKIRDISDKTEIIPILNFFSVIVCNAFLVVVPRFGVSARSHEEYCRKVQTSLETFHSLTSDETNIRECILKLPAHGGIWEQKWRKSKNKIGFPNVLKFIKFLIGIVGTSVILISIPDEFVLSSLLGLACLLFTFFFLGSIFGIYDDLDYGKDIFCISRKFLTFTFKSDYASDGCYQYPLDEVCAFFHLSDVHSGVNFSSTECHTIKLLDIHSGITLSQVRSEKAAEEVVRILSEFLQICHEDLYKAREALNP